MSRDLDNTKILLYKPLVRYLVVKPACTNAALYIETLELSMPKLICQIYLQLTSYCVVAGLFVGKEGPMIHSGGVIGAGIPQFESLTFRKFRLRIPYFRSDR